MRALAKIKRPAFATRSADLLDPSNSAALGGANFKPESFSSFGFESQNLYALVANQAEENLVNNVSHVVQNFAPTFAIATIESHQETNWVNHPTNEHEHTHRFQTFLNTFRGGLHGLCDLGEQRVNDVQPSAA